MKFTLLLLGSILIASFKIDVMANHNHVEPTIVIQNVTVIPMDRERMLENHSVVIKGNLIESILADGEPLPSSIDALVDGEGKYLIPGLTEMHAHIAARKDDPELDRIMTLYLVNGVTRARSMLGQNWHLQLRDQINAGNYDGPNLILSGPSLNGSSAPSAKAAAKMVKEQKRAGFDFLKIHPGLTKEAFAAMARSAKAEQLPFAGHVSQKVGVEAAMQAGQSSIDHMDGFLIWLASSDQNPGFFGFDLTDKVDANQVDVLAKTVAAYQTAVVPTESLMVNVAAPVDVSSLSERPEMRYFPAAAVKRWTDYKSDAMAGDNYSAAKATRYLEIRQQLIKALHDSGVPLLLGSDSPQIFNVPGFSIHHELKIMVDSGLSPYQALATGTANSDDYLQRYRLDGPRSGRVLNGYRADLVLLNSNPLLDITNSTDIDSVIANGRLMTRAEIDKRLAKLKR